MFEFRSTFNATVATISSAPPAESPWPVSEQLLRQLWTSSLLQRLAVYLFGFHFPFPDPTTYCPSLNVKWTLGCCGGKDGLILGATLLPGESIGRNGQALSPTEVRPSQDTMVSNSFCIPWLCPLDACTPDLKHVRAMRTVTSFSVYLLMPTPTPISAISLGRVRLCAQFMLCSNSQPVSAGERTCALKCLWDSDIRP